MKRLRVKLFYLLVKTPFIAIIIVALCFISCYLILTSQKLVDLFGYIFK